ncbi:hypothetical protein HHI36_006215 [Cryptolaemus montrouzieri]|uniref:limulus clotting factor C n=1 Tax=Cryptolaemus montrouzieri TaxID=559131 RepID=A0ABD2NWE3_9CUCU
MGDYSIWGSWSAWSKCNQSCRTYRKRYCRKPGRCKKRKQIQNAYCYHRETKCQIFVFDMMKTEEKLFDVGKYAYDNKTTKRRRLMKSSLRCGMQYKKSRMLRIIGGTESPRYKWPWHVALINQYAEIFCGGTLIAPEWVLTASHCIRNFLSVRLNEHDLRHTDGREMELVVYRVFQHPQFSTQTVNGDIALLQLPIPVRLPVACLPDRKPIPRQMCSAMGWGKTNPHAKHGATRLRETQIPIVPETFCKWAYRDLLITDNMVCAGWPSGKSDTCAGDSGGGLICPQKRSNTGRITYSVQGITSFGKGCGRRNKYGIYTVVYNYLDWIEYIMDRYSVS